MCAVSPGFSNSEENKMINTVINEEDIDEPVTATPEPQYSSWLDINNFPKSNLRFENCATEDIYHKTGYHNIHKTENESDDEKELKHIKDFIVNSGMNNIEVNMNKLLSKDDHRVNADDDTENLCYLYISFLSELTSQS